jgi:hypothetical protein
VTIPPLVSSVDAGRVDLEASFHGGDVARVSSTVPVNLVNCPRTVASPMCLALKPTVVWDASITHGIKATSLYLRLISHYIFVGN